MCSCVSFFLKRETLKKTDIEKNRLRPHEDIMNGDTVKVEREAEGKVERVSNVH